MKKLLFILAFAGALHAQTSSPTFQYVDSAPSGNCPTTPTPPIQIVYSTGVAYSCNSGVWGAFGSGAAGTLPIPTAANQAPVSTAPGSAYLAMGVLLSGGNLNSTQTAQTPTYFPSVGTMLQVDGFPINGGQFRGAWNNSTTYNRFDTVTSGGVDWIAANGSVNVNPAEGAAGASQFWFQFDATGAGAAATQADCAYFWAKEQVQIHATGFGAYSSVGLHFGSRVGGYAKNGDWTMPTNTFGYTVSLFGDGRGQTRVYQTSSTLQYMVVSPNVNSSGGQTINGITLDANLLAGGCLSHHLRRSLINDVVCWNPQEQPGGTIGAAMWLGSGADAYESMYSHLLVRSPTYNGILPAIGTATVTAGAITGITYTNTGTNLNLPVTAGPGLVAYFIGKGATSSSWKPCGTMPVVSSIALTGGSINTGTGIGGITFSGAGSTCGGTIYVRIQQAGTLLQGFYFNGSDTTADDIVTSGDFKAECEFVNGPVLLSHEHPYCAAPYQIEATGGYQDHIAPQLDSPIQYGFYMGGTGGTVIHAPVTEFNAGSEFGAGDFLVDAASGTITIEGSGCYPGSPQNFGGYTKFTGTTTGPITPSNFTPSSTSFISGAQQNCDGTGTLWGTYSASGGGLPTAAKIGQVPTSTAAGTTYTAQTPLGGSTWYYPVEWFGAVGDATGAAGVGTDNTTAIQACLTAVATAGEGQCLLQAKKYRITSALSISASSVGIAGVSYGAFSVGNSNQLKANAPVSGIVIDSASADAVDVNPSGSLGSPVSFNKFNDFTIIRTVADNGTGTGCATLPTGHAGASGLSIQYAGGFIVDHVWSQDSACNFYFLNAGAYGTGSVENSGAMWGANGFNPVTNVYGFFYNGTESAESFRLRNSFAQTIANGFSGVQSVGFLISGPQMNDIFLEHLETAFVTYGEYFQYTGSADGYSASDIHLNQCVNDSFFQDGIVIDSLTEGGGAQVEINGGWNTTNASGSATNSAGISIINSTGVTVSNVGFGQNGSQEYGVLASGSSHLAIVGNRFLNQDQSAVSLSTSSDVTVTGNTISAPASPGVSTMIKGVSLTHSIISGNTLGGTASVGVSLDSGSSHNDVFGVAAIDPTSITTPVANAGTANIIDSAVTSLTTTGTSGSATLTAGVLNVPNYSGGGGAGDMVLLQKQTASGTPTSITFSTISQSYSHLMLVANFGSSSGGDNMTIQFNGDTTSAHYAWGLNYQSGTGTTGSATGSLSDAKCIMGGTNGVFNMSVPAYTAPGSTGVEASATWSAAVIGSGMASGTGGCAWTGTDVTSIKLFLQGGSTISNGSVFSLYGLN